jgi:hypothetical protein
VDPALRNPGVEPTEVVLDRNLHRLVQHRGHGPIVLAGLRVDRGGERVVDIGLLRDELPDAALVVVVQIREQHRNDN